MFHFLQGKTETTHINAIIQMGASTRMTDRRFLEREITAWKQSARRKAQILGEKYYNGEHDILKRRRMIIAENGELKPVKNLPNSRIVDNQYAKMVDQKVNYLLGKPVTFDTEDQAYTDALLEIFDTHFLRQLRILGEDALDGGVGWLMPYYDDEGAFRFRRFEPYEILPFWADAEHTRLDAAVRLYEVEAYEGETKRIVEHVEAFSRDGISYYVRENGTLVPEAPYHTPYAVFDHALLNWTRIPLIAWKANAKELPLIRRVKALQDGINLMESIFENGMLEDPHNTVLVLVNYDGTSLGEFRRNLATYGAVKVRNDVGSPNGDVKTLSVEVNAENYQTILKLFKQALVENARGYDAKDDRLGNNPNQMNIQSMYSDIDLDANTMETEFQAAFRSLIWFVDAHLANIGRGDFEDVPAKITFNRDVLINTSERIQQCKDSIGLVSDRTLLANHPFVKDVDQELLLLKAQKEEEMKSVYGENVFPKDKEDGGQSPPVSKDA